MYKQKKPFTLLEIMIVILLIGLIGSVIGYNMKGSLDEGRAFKTRQGITQITDILELEMAKTGVTAQEIVKNPEKHLRESGLVKNATKLLTDGWGVAYKIELDTDNQISITSEALNKYNNKKLQ